MLYDCTGPATDAELIVVEGLSAAANLKRGRDAKNQAILALQGKLVNTAKASAKRIGRDPQLSLLRQTLCGDKPTDQPAKDCRYKRLVLIFDPDADGVHCGALLQIYLHIYLPQLVQSQQVTLVRAPSHEIHLSGESKPVYAYSDAHYQLLQKTLRDRGYSVRQSTRFKGVASLQLPLLQMSCLNSATRLSNDLSLTDTRAAMQVFAGV